MAEFDPYLKWLGIREDTRPLDHYTLLGIERFEDDPEVIVSAADRQMAHVRSFQTGARGEIAQKVLNQLARARRCLMTEDKKNAYDEQLRTQLNNAEPTVAHVEEFSEPPQIVTNINIDVEPGEGPQLVSPLRSEKSNNGMLWTIVGGLGGGICAIVFCFFLLNGFGDSDTEELSSSSVEESSSEGDEKTASDNESSETIGREQFDGSSSHARPWESPLVDGGKSPEDGELDPVTPPDPAETEGGDPVDSSEISGLAKQFQSQLDILLQRYQARADDPAGEEERKRLRRESAEIVKLYPQLKLVDRIEAEFPVVGGEVVKGDDPVESPELSEAEKPDFSLPKFYSIVEVEGEKKDLPNENEIREQEALIESLYESEFKTAEDDIVAAREFAKQLVAQASSSSDSPAQVYVLFQKGIELARKIGDGESAAIAFLGLQDEFVSSENWDEIRKTIDAIRRKVKTDEQARVFYRGVILLSQRAYAVDNFGEAEFLMGKGFGVARKLDHVTAESYFARIRDYFGELKEAHSLNSETDPQLDLTSTDSPALESRGNYLVYLKQDLKGFEYWVKSENEDLRSLAKMEIECAQDPSVKNQYELGKLWYERAKNYKTFEDHFGLSRAAMLLRPLIGQLNGLQQTVAMNFVDRIDEIYAPIFPEQETIGLFPSVLKNGKVFYFEGEDSGVRSRIPSGVYVQFGESDLVKAYFEAGADSEGNGNIRLSYRSSLGGILISGDRRYRISIHSTHQPMKLSLEFLDSKGRASKPMIFDQSSVPGVLPERFGGQ